METFFITNDEQIHRVISGGAAFRVERYTPPIILLPMTARKILRSAVWRHIYGGAVNTATVIITNDFNEQFNISGKNSVGSGVVVSEFIEIKQ